VADADEISAREHLPQVRLAAVALAALRLATFQPRRRSLGVCPLKIFCLDVVARNADEINAFEVLSRGIALIVDRDVPGVCSHAAAEVRLSSILEPFGQAL